MVKRGSQKTLMARFGIRSRGKHEVIVALRRLAEFCGNTQVGRNSFLLKDRCRGAGVAVEASVDGFAVLAWAPSQIQANKRGGGRFSPMETIASDVIFDEVKPGRKHRGCRGDRISRGPAQIVSEIVC